MCNRLAQSLMHITVQRIRDRLPHKAVVIGSGDHHPEVVKPKVKWQHVNAAFQSRITTGVITNLSHSNTNAFLRMPRKFSLLIFKKSCESIGV